MLEFHGDKSIFCDGISRRSLLRVGALGIGGLTLPNLLRARSQAAPAVSSKTAVIFIELAGGPTHIETYDPKPRAPIEFRGPLNHVRTSVPGTIFCEALPHQAKVADKLSVIRSIHHDSSSHRTSSHLTQTGYYLRDRRRRENDMPSAGSITAKVRGANARGIPPYVAVPRDIRYGNAAYLGKQYNSLATGGDPNRDNFQVQNLDLHRALSVSRLEDRKKLLAAIDRRRGMIDLENAAQAYDEFNVQAFEMVTGERARQAFDISQEPDALRDTYGRTTEGQSMLLARRLVEAGVTFVTVRSAGWDMHRGLVKSMKSRGANFDRGVAALISDLYDRGMQRDVLVVAMGEFGRTPRWNKRDGRDHWGSVMSVMLSGGPFRMGQVVGASSSKGEVPDDKPYRPENILASIYHHLGIDPAQTFPDFSGRPRYILEDRGLIEELV